MRVIGLTGSIGMGKSTAAAMLRRLGIPVHDADATVHRLTAPKGRAIVPIAARFPGVVDANGVLDRRALADRAYAAPSEIKALEAILHPLVRDAEKRFMMAARRRRVPVVVLDIPLLFETRGERRCDAVWVVSAAPTIQAQRVLRRPGMTAARLAEIRARQVPDAVKRRRADLVVPSGLGRRFARDTIVRGLACLRRSSRSSADA